MQNSSYTKSDITIGIVIYNSEGTILKCLSSLVSSSQNISQIIIVDNGSVDKTISLIEGFKDLKANIKIIKNSENNIALARNKIIQAAESKLVAFIDSDCIAPENWLDCLLEGYNTISDSRVFAVCGPNRLPETTVFKVAANSSFNYPWGHGYSPQAWAPRSTQKVSHAPTTNALFNRERVLEVGNFDPKLKNVGEDLDLGLRAQSYNYSCYLLPKPTLINDSADTLGEWASRMYRFGKVQAPVKFLNANVNSSFKLGLYVGLALILLAVVLASLVPLMVLYIAALSYGMIKIAHNHRSYTTGLHSFLFLLVTHISYGLGVVKGIAKGKPY